MNDPKIMIHASPKRMPYIKTFLLPQLKEMGFKNIKVWNDEEHKGCLKSYLESWESLPNRGNTWHLQDDVLPDRRFYQWAVEWENFPGIINGFGNKWFYNTNMFGFAKNSSDMFYSFPGIMIPNRVVKDFLKWFDKAKETDVNILPKLEENKYIDYFFKLFIGDNPNEIPIYNFRPCIFEHVDEYVKGSLVNEQRVRPAKALEFEDDEMQTRLDKWYKERYEHDEG